MVPGPTLLSDWPAVGITKGQQGPPLNQLPWGDGRRALQQRSCKDAGSEKFLRAPGIGPHSQAGMGLADSATFLIRGLGTGPP